MKVRLQLPFIFLSVVALSAASASGQVSSQRDAPRKGDPAKPELVVQTGHTRTISSISWSPTAEWFVTSADDGSLRIWDASNGRLLRSIITGSTIGHGQTISPDGQSIAAPSLNNSIRIWNVRTGEVVRTLSDPAKVKAVTYCDGPGRLASLDFDNRIRIWDAQTGSQIRVFGDGHADLQLIACNTDAETVGVADRNGPLQLWNSRTGSSLGTLGGTKKVWRLAIAFSPDGRLLAEGGLSEAINIWDVHSKTKLRSLFRRDSEASSLSFSPDGRTLAATSGATVLWDVNSGKLLETVGPRGANITQFSPRGDMLAIVDLGNSITLLRRYIPLVLSGHPRSTYSVAWSPDGKILASAGKDKTIRLWNSSTGELIKTIADGDREPSSVAFSHNGHLLARGGELGIRVLTWKDSHVIFSRETSCDPPNEGCLKRFAFSPDDRLLAYLDVDVIHLIDLGDFHEYPTLPGGSITSISFTQDGRYLVTGGLDKTIKVWDLATHKLEQACPTGDSVTSIAVSPDGAWVVSGGPARSKIRLWALKTCIVFQEFDDRFLNGFGEVNSIAFTSDGQHLASSRTYSGGVAYWDITSGRGTALETDNSTNSLAFDSSGRLALAFDTGTIRILPTALGQDSISFTSFADSPRVVGFADQDRLIQFSSFGRIGSWDMTTGTLSGASLHANGGFQDTVQAHVREMGSVAFTSIVDAAISPDGSSVIATVNVGEPHLDIALIDARTGLPKWDIPDPNGNKTSALAFSPDGRYLAIGSVSVVGMKLVAGLLRLWDAATGHEIRQLDVAAYRVAFSPDSKRVAYDSGDELGVIDISTGARVQTFRLQEPPNVLCFARDGRKLFVGGSIHIFAYDLATGVVSETFEHGSNGEGDEIEALALNPTDDSMLASASTNGSIKLWDVSQGKQIYDLLGHAGFVTSISFSKDGRWLASASEDGTVRLWDSHEHTYRATLISEDSDWVVVTPEGLFDGSPQGWTRICWRFGGDTFRTAPVEAFFKEYYSPGLLANLFSGRVSTAPGTFGGEDIRQPTIRITASPLRLSGESVTSLVFALDQIKASSEVSPAPPDQEHTDPSGARDVRLFRNGSLVKIWHGPVEIDKQGRAILRADVRIVAGENQLTAYAFNNDNIKSNDATLTVIGADALKRKGTAYILAIGVDQYANKNFDLRYAAADAQAFAQELKAKQEKLGSFEHIEVVLLLNSQATRANIVAALGQLAVNPSPLPAGAPTELDKLKTARPEDAVFIYFASHGTADGARFYLIPYDMGFEGARDAIDDAAMENITEHSISDEELNALFENVDAGRMLLVIDACNSGQALGAEELRPGPMNSKGLAQLAYEKGIYILAAAQAYQQAQEVNRFGHGLLTYALVEEGLKQGKASARGGDIFLREWLDYAVQEVPQLQLNWLQGEVKRGFTTVNGIELKSSDSARLVLQHPRVFYRREAESIPLIIARHELPSH